MLGVMKLGILWLSLSVLSCPATSCHQVRNLRTLCDSKGKSVGILLLEYSDIQSVRRATEADGICRMRMLQGFGIVPRVMLVSAFAAFIRSWPHLTRQHRNQSLMFAASHFLEGPSYKQSSCGILQQILIWFVGCCVRIVRIVHVFVCVRFEPRGQRAKRLTNLAMKVGYIHTYIQTDRQTDGQIDRRTDIHTR